jgi:hypothetical protein
MTKSLREILLHSGDIFLSPKVNKFLLTDIIGNKNDTFYISNWSLIHLITGIIFGYIVNEYLVLETSDLLIDNYYFKMFILHTIWELWQVFISMSNPFKLVGHNNLIDTIVDTLLFMLGAYIYKEFLSP